MELVRRFLGALERYDVDALGACCAPDMLYFNNRLRTAKGRAQFEKVMKGMAGATTSFEVEGLSIFEDPEGVVHADRLDWITVAGLRIGIDVRGRFEVRDGLVLRWTDYFGWGQTLGAIVRGRPAYLRARSRRARKPTMGVHGDRGEARS